MSTQRGFALVAVLWVVVALAGLALTASSRAQVGAAGAESRVLAVRGRWAAEACLAAAHARLNERAVRGEPFIALPPDTIALRDGSRCAAEMADSADQVLITARGWVSGSLGAAKIEVLMVSAGVRVAPVRRHVW